MVDPGLQEASRLLSKGMVVAPAEDLMGVQSPEGQLVACEELGPGIVEQIDPQGLVRVRWMAAGFDAWMERADLASKGPDSRVVTVRQYGNQGKCKLARHMVSDNSGLRYNWTVEVRPGNVVRVVRSDGAAWTFWRIPFLNRIRCEEWSAPPEDDDAEAIAVAELGVFGRR
jgi:hypothetical protein